MTRNSEITLAVQRALAMSAVAAAAAATSLPAQAQQAPAATGNEEIQTVVVTGSRIRRVDTETASPVLTIDPAEIRQSGAATVGDLAMMLPTVNGSATNPSVNNGGGFGESYIELRGLDAKRTLILIDGRRVGLIGDPGSGTSAVDVNQIPLAIIDHVEVLKEGAGAVYGSDAIAGVINFITRKDLQGGELSADYGRTTADDGAHRQFNLSYGLTTEKMTFMISGRYQHQDPVLESRRDFSKYALYNSSSSIYAGGSSRTPTGSIFLPAGNALATSLGCTKITKITGASGASLTDYRCFVGGGPNDDHYNYAPLNFLVTPQERGSIFSKLNYNINDNLTAYTSVLYNRTASGFQYASLPFDSVDDNIVVSSASMYNPFGISFGGQSGANTDAEWRLTGLAPRHSDTATETLDTTFGLKGNLFSTGWTWDLFAQYGRLDQSADIGGYFFSSGLSAALGPSMLVNGVPTCVAQAGNPATAIAGCTPIDIFAVNDLTASTPAERAAFQTVGANYNTDYTYRTRSFALDVQGKVFSLPAGDALLDVGAEYRYQEGIFVPDQVVTSSPPLFLGCGLSQETCTTEEKGGYSNHDLYGELFVPLLKDMPLVHSLNVDVGLRFSNYSEFQKTTRASFKVEYRPITDLLVRGTFAQVYRAPTVLDIGAGPKVTSVNFIDPCNGLTVAKVTATPGLANECVGVPTDGSFHEANGQVTGLLLSNPNLKPETGQVSTVGFVYDASWLRGFSFDADYWTYTINSVIVQLDPAFSAAQCIAVDQYCSNAIRYGASTALAGQILEYLQPTENLGTLKTSGEDIGLRYQVRDTSIGQFKFDLELTHVNSFENSGAGPTIEYAGTYSRQYGNDATWRGLLTGQWSWQGISVLLSEQWIGKLTIPDGSPNSANPVIDIPAIFYTNLSAGYTYAPTKTHVTLGLENLTNRQPPIFYQNNVVNANTDVSTYDTLGRRWFISITQQF